MNLKQLWPMISILAVAVMMQACNESVKWHTPPECKDEGYVWCNDGCIDPKTDNAFCGADALCEKFTACKDGKTCQNGECVGAGPVNHCEHGKVKCGEDCIDPMTDNDHCGADSSCQNYTACVDDKTCVGGECSAKPVDGKCPEGQVKCGEDCIDPQKNNAFCGADATCEHYSDCAKQGKTCESGECVGGVVNDCESGKVKCGADCIDPMTDNDHCGADANCENFTACVDDKTCVGGECSTKPEDGKCNDGLVKCGEACIDPQTNKSYCGADAECANYDDCAADGKTCEAGVCVGGTVNDCEPGKVKCGEDCIDPRYNDKYCGADANCQNYTECGEYEWCMNSLCGSMPTPQECEPGQSCQIREACEPGSNTCIEADDGFTYMESCHESGKIIIRNPCETNDPNAHMVCSDDGCIQQCNKQHEFIDDKCTLIVCKELEEHCNGDQVLSCNSDQTAFDTHPCTTDDPNAVPFCIEEQELNPLTGKTFVQANCRTMCKDGYVPDNAHAGRCIEKICEPYTYRCDGIEVLQCNHLGTAWEHHDNCVTDENDKHHHVTRICDSQTGSCAPRCDEPYVWMDGACVLLACAEGERICDGDRILVCNASGTGFEVEQVCSSDDPGERAKCEDNACVTECSDGYVRINGVCQKLICEPGNTKCDGDAVMKCNSQGTAYEMITCPALSDTNARNVCQNGACTKICDHGTIEIGGVCTVPTCTKGQYACNGTWVMVCDESGMNYTKYRTCAVSAYDANNIGTCVNDSECEYHCRDGYTKVDGICQKEICEPGAVSCNGDHTKVQRCNETGTQWVDAETCRDDQTCNDSSCVCRGTGVECNGRCVQYRWDCTDVPCNEPKPKEACVCYAGEWDCPDDPCDEAGRLNGGCACVKGKWDCPDVWCDPALKTSDACICVDDAWDCPEPTCEGVAADEDCVCVDSNWECPAPAAIWFTLKADTPSSIQEGDSVTFEVKLNRAPKNTVTVALSVNGSAVTTDDQLSSNSLEFTADNWSTTQNVTLSTARDYRETDDRVLTIKAQTTSSQAIFNGLEAEQAVTVKNLDVCTVMVVPMMDLQTSEDGSIQEIELSLTCKPNSTVLYRFASDNEAEGKPCNASGTVLSEAQISFTSENWYVPQILRIKGINDNPAVSDGAQFYNVIGTPDSGNPDDFKTPIELELFNLDNDMPNIHVAESVTVTEGLGDERKVSLSTKPAANVTMTFSLPANSGVELETTTLTFTPDAYQNLAYSLFVPKDHVLTGPRSTTITVHTTSSDQNYNNLTKTVTYNILESDVAGLAMADRDWMYGCNWPLFRANEGETICPEFRLLTKPTQNVTIKAVVGTSEDDLNGQSPEILKSIEIGPSVTFTPENWDQYQCISIKQSRDGRIPEKGYNEYYIAYRSESDHYPLAKMCDGMDDFSLYSRFTNIETKGLYYIYPKFDFVEGQDGYIDVQLKVRPSSNFLKFNIGSTDPNVLSPTTQSIQFNNTDEDWKTPVRIAFKTFNNYMVDVGGKRTAQLTLTVDGTDEVYTGKKYNSTIINVMDASKPSILVTRSRKVEYQFDYSSEDFMNCGKGAHNFYDYKVSLSMRPPKPVDVVITQDLNHQISLWTLTFTPDDYNIQQGIHVQCVKDLNARSNVMNNTIRFSMANPEDYPAEPVSDTYKVYPIGVSWEYRYYNQASAEELVLVPGKYHVWVVGATGGSLKGVGHGNGGIVDAEIEILKKAPVFIYPGGMGKQGPSNGVAENNSGGRGYRKGGNGDWGTKNFSYGGGGSSEIHFGSTEERSIVAGGGGGNAVTQSDHPVGTGGLGGCTDPYDDRCKGKYYDYRSAGATQSDGNGESSTWSQSQGGGGGGYRGGASGSEKYCGGNGGTSAINVNSYFKVLKREFIVSALGTCQMGGTHDGCVIIEILE